MRWKALLVPVFLSIHQMWKKSEESMGKYIGQFEMYINESFLGTFSTLYAYTTPPPLPRDLQVYS